MVAIPGLPPLNLSVPLQGASSATGEINQQFTFGGSGTGTAAWPFASNNASVEIWKYAAMGLAVVAIVFLWKRKR